MKIVFIAEKYPPIVGGGETQLEQLAVGLAHAGHEVTVGTDRTGLEMASERDGVRLAHVPGLRDACKTLCCHEAVQNVYRLLSTEAADVVHVVNYIPALLLTWLRSAIRTPIFLSTFETFVPRERVFGMFDSFPLEDALQRSVATELRPDVVFCGSQAYRRWALAAGFPEETLRVIHHATDTHRFAFSARMREAFREKRGWAPDEFVFLVPARPVPRKRIEDILSAAAILTPRHRLRILLTSPTDRGNPAYIRRLAEQIADLGIQDRVSWEHDLGWTDMPALYSASDAVVLPSSHEGFGISLIEAMAASRPVVATEIEGPVEFVKHGVTGLLYPVGDIPRLVDCMARLMSNDHSAIVERALGMAKSDFSIEAMTRRFSDVYMEHQPLGH